MGCMQCADILLVCGLWVETGTLLGRAMCNESVPLQVKVFFVDMSEADRRWVECKYACIWSCLLPDGARAYATSCTLLYCRTLVSHWIIIGQSVGWSPSSCLKKTIVVCFFKQVSHASTLVIVFTVIQHMRLVERKRSNFVKDNLWCFCWPWKAKNHVANISYSLTITAYPHFHSSLSSSSLTLL